jgi:Protein of unknown function (DUF541)
MHRLITPVALTTAAVLAAGALGSASADTTTTPPTTPPAAAAPAPRLLTINGGADVSVRSDSPKAVFSAAYRTELSAALDDASAKATALAAKEGLTLGAIQSITETSNSPTNGCNEYDGPMADGAAGLAAPTPAPKKAKSKKSKKAKKNAHVHPRAVSWTSVARDDDSSDDADVYPCDVTANVTVSYAIQ